MEKKVILRRYITQLRRKNVVVGFYGLTFSLFIDEKPPKPQFLEEGGGGRKMQTPSKWPENKHQNIIFLQRENCKTLSENLCV